jgi:hypothetical protein
MSVLPNHHAVLLVSNCVLTGEVVPSEKARRGCVAARVLRICYGPKTSSRWRMRLTASTNHPATCAKRSVNDGSGSRNCSDQTEREPQ